MHALNTLDIWWATSAPILLLSFYYLTQGLYSLSFLVDGYLFSRPVNMVDMDEGAELVEGSKEDYPLIVLFYPVLDEEESVMRTTMIALDELDYPKDRYRVIAIPNADDGETIAALKNLQGEFPFPRAAGDSVDRSSLVASRLECVDPRSTTEGIGACDTFLSAFRQFQVSAVKSLARSDADALDDAHGFDHRDAQRPHAVGR